MGINFSNFKKKEEELKPETTADSIFAEKKPE